MIPDAAERIEALRAMRKLPEENSSALGQKSIELRERSTRLLENIHRRLGTAAGPIFPAERTDNELVAVLISVVEHSVCQPRKIRVIRI